ncbi:MAG: hypothetical protein GF308_00010 [Candidatus Heimdallarchaeota archaeon]|nr:hypothetical protein [Candidatus Heimdallarchaeota archaeon]
MSMKEAKSLGLIPRRLSSTEKKIFSALSTYGASTPEEISKYASLSKRRVSSTLPKLENKGLILPLKGVQGKSQRYVATYPIELLTEILTTLKESLRARTSELAEITKVVNDFTEQVIKEVREASSKENQKRIERSERDIKELELAMDASLSGILASVEMDLKDLGEIAKSSTEFLSESSIRMDETCINIQRGLEPIVENFRMALTKAEKNSQDKLGSTVDARISEVLDLEIAAGEAFEEVIDAFQDSQTAFEEIIFNVLDAGIEDLERVTRPITDRLEEAINSLTAAIRKAANYSRQEILRVLTEQKRPMVTTVDNLRAIVAKRGEAFIHQHRERFAHEFKVINDLLISHNEVFSEGRENLTENFTTSIIKLVETSLEQIDLLKKELIELEQEFKETTTQSFDEKEILIHDTSATTRDSLNDMLEQFIIVLNQSVAKYQMDLGDNLSTLESDFLSAVENNATNIQNLTNFINLTLIRPLSTASDSLMDLTKTLRESKNQHLTRFEEKFVRELDEIPHNFQKESTKNDQRFYKDSQRLQNRFEKELKENQIFLEKRTTAFHNEFMDVLEGFTQKANKEARDINDVLSATNTRLEKWYEENSSVLQAQIDEQIQENVQKLQYNLSTLIDGLNAGEQISKEELVSTIKTSLTNVSKSFENFGQEIKEGIQNSLDEVNDSLKKENKLIDDWLTKYQKNQEKLIVSTGTPSKKLIRELKEDYESFYQRLETQVTRFLNNGEDLFKRNKKELWKNVESRLESAKSKSSKELDQLRKDYKKTVLNYEKKVKESFSTAKNSLTKESESVLDQEESARTSIISLTEEIISNLSNNVNTTAEELRSSLWDGAESIFNQTVAEINKQEIELAGFYDNQREQTISQYLHGVELLKKKIKTFRTDITSLHENQTKNVKAFTSKYSHLLEQDLLDQQEKLKTSQEKLQEITEDMITKFNEEVDQTSNNAIQELEVHTAGIEGAIFDTVERIMADTERRTGGVIVIGEQAVLDIEERYTENLERIRQNLTDEVVQRIDQETNKINEIQANIKQMGRLHLKTYGEAVSNLNELIQQNLEEGEKAAQLSLEVCEGIACRSLRELNQELGAMGDRVKRSTDNLMKGLIRDFERVSNKIKRESTLFARKQFKLSNKSNQEIAESFLVSVDDLENVMLKQLDNFSQRTINTINKTAEISEEVTKTIEELTTAFNDLS